MNKLKNLCDDICYTITAGFFLSFIGSGILMGILDLFEIEKSYGKCYFHSFVECVSYEDCTLMCR